MGRPQIDGGKRKRISRKLTNSECMRLYLKYRDGENTEDLAEYFGLHRAGLCVVIRRIEEEARKRGLHVDSCLRERGAQWKTPRRHLNSDIYDDQYISSYAYDADDDFDEVMA